MLEIIGVRNDAKIDPVLISTGDEGAEIIEVKLGKMRTRIFNCYGPQENSDASKYFYCKLDEEIESAINDGTAVVIEMDCNAKLGSSIIKGDPHQMSENGAMLNEILIN